MDQLPDDENKHSASNADAHTATEDLSSPDAPTRRALAAVASELVTADDISPVERVRLAALKAQQEIDAANDVSYQTRAFDFADEAEDAEVQQVNSTGALPEVDKPDAPVTATAESLFHDPSLNQKSESEGLGVGGYEPASKSKAQNAEVEKAGDSEVALGIPPVEEEIASKNKGSSPLETSLDYESPPESGSEDGLAEAAVSSGGWTIPILCLGLGLIACCLLIPLCDANRRTAYERLKLRLDLESLQQQVSTNDQFLHDIEGDPSLAERLAQRQMRKIRVGTRVLALPSPSTPAGEARPGPRSMSPFQIVAVRPPAPLAPYQPLGGSLAALCYNPHSRLYLTGVGLMLLAIGLILGYVPSIKESRGNSSMTS